MWVVHEYGICACMVMWVELYALLWTCRNLMKNLVIGYVHAAKHKKTEVLHLIAKILDFTSDELEQAVGGGPQAGGWLGRFWHTPAPNQVRRAREEGGLWCIILRQLNQPQH